MIGTQIIFQAFDKQLYAPGELVNYQFLLIDDFGNGVYSQIQVKLHVDNILVALITTATNGYGLAQLPAPEQPGPHAVHAEYDGTVDYGPSQASTTMNVAGAAVPGISKTLVVAGIAGAGVLAGAVYWGTRKKK